MLGAAFLAVSVVPAQEPVRELPRSSAEKPGDYTVEAGTKVPLSLINTISTKHSAAGDRVYLETSFPILSNGRIVIPVGSYVAGTVTQVTRPGRVKGRGELYIRFDSLTLPNGVTRDFRARIASADGQITGELDRSEGKVKSEGSKAGDARTVGEVAGTGASVGAIAGSAGGRPVMGLGIGAAAGAAAGLIGVLATRGPDAVLPRGSTVEMVLDRNLNFLESDLEFGNYQPPRASPSAAPAPASNNSGNGGVLGGRRFPW
jgi:type IV secretion system protein VirB10